MNKRTLKALKKSIIYWTGIAYKNEICYGVLECALCQEFNNSETTTPCNGCPVFKSTRKTYCSGTPYQDWEGYNHAPYKVRDSIPITQEIAIAQLQFLQGLLPKEQSFLPSKNISETVMSYHWNTKNGFKLPKDSL
jgi:hypothetical protein